MCVYRPVVTCMNVSKIDFSYYHQSCVYNISAANSRGRSFNYEFTWLQLQHGPMHLTKPAGKILKAHYLSTSAALFSFSCFVHIAILHKYMIICLGHKSSSSRLVESHHHPQSSYREPVWPVTSGSDELLTRRDDLRAYTCAH